MRQIHRLLTFTDDAEAERQSDVFEPNSGAIRAKFAESARGQHCPRHSDHGLNP